MQPKRSEKQHPLFRCLSVIILCFGMIQSRQIRVLKLMGGKTSDVSPSNATRDFPLEYSNRFSQRNICAVSNPLTFVNGSHFTLRFQNANESKKLEYVILGQDEMHHVQTNNHINAFLHAIDFALDHQRLVVIVEHSWVFRSLAQLFEINQDWLDFFGISTISKSDIGDLNRSDTIFKTGDEMYFYHSLSSKETLVSRRMKMLKYLWSHPSVPLCSMLHDLRIPTSNYIVIHNRWMPNNGCLNRLGSFAYKLQNQTGIRIDRRAPCLLEPSYIKNILRINEFMDKIHLIYVIGDGWNPNIVTNLQKDKDIGDRVRTIPDHQSSVGSDMMLAVLSSIFIGTPISTLSGNVARARISLGFHPDTNYLFPKKRDESHHDDEWDFICQSMECLLDSSIMQGYVG